jgi:hypothetical protein
LIAAILEHVNRLLECLRHIVTIGVDPSFGGFALLRGMEETAAIAEAVSVTKKSLTLKENGAEEPACAIKAKMCLAPEQVFKLTCQ